MINIAGQYLQRRFWGWVWYGWGFASSGGGGGGVLGLEVGGFTPNR